MTDWNKKRPELHCLNGDIYRELRRKGVESAFGAQLSAAIDEFEQSKANLADLENRYEEYFEREVVARGNACLLNESKPVQGHTWTNYCRTVLPGDRGKLRKSLLNGEYKRLAKKQEHEQDSLRRAHMQTFPCFQPDKWSDQTPATQVRTEGTIDLWAWAPDALMDAWDRREVARFRIPLPPEDIGRDYSNAELCLSLAAIYVADGSYPPLWSDALRKLNEEGKGLWWAALAQVEKNAEDAWVPSLRAALDRLVDRLPKPVVKKKKKGRPAADEETRDDEAELVQDWEGRKERRTTRTDFAGENGMKLKQFEDLQGSVRKRKARADK